MSWIAQVTGVRKGRGSQFGHETVREREGSFSRARNPFSLPFQTPGTKVMSKTRLMLLTKSIVLSHQSISFVCGVRRLTLTITYSMLTSFFTLVLISSSFAFLLICSLLSSILVHFEHPA